MEKITTVFRKEKFAYISGVAFSILLFLAIYGIQPLNIFNTSWLDRYDIVQKQFINWASFRNDEWSFPLVTAHTDFMVEGRVVLWDIIPLFAIICKLISPLLPSSFQYFGIWALINTALFGFFSVKLFKRFIENNIKVVVASALLLVLTLLMGRLYIFTPLNAQWIVLVCLIITFKSINEQFSDKKLVIEFLVLTAVASFIHIYFSLICLSFSVGIVVYRLLYAKDKKTTLIIGLGCLCITFVITQILGTNPFILFEGETATYRIPLFSLYCTNDDLYNIYIGFGEICFIGYIFYSYFSKNRLRDWFILHWKKCVVFLTIISVATFLVVFPFEVITTKKDGSIITAYKTLLVSITAPIFILYIGIVASIIYLVKTQTYKNIFLIIAIMISLQFDNIGANIKDGFWNNKKDTVSFDEKIWTEIAENKRIERVAMLYEVKDALTIRQWAAENGKIINDSLQMSSLEENIERFLKSPDDKTVYVFDKYNQSISYWKYDSLNYYYVDDYVVAYKEPINGIEAASLLDLSARKFDMNDRFYFDGEIVDEVKTLFPKGESYGPYCELAAGLYEVSVKGDVLKDNISITIYSDTAGKAYDYNIIKKDYDKIVLKVRFEEDVDSLQFIIDNKSDKNIYLQYIKVTPLELLE